MTFVSYREYKRLGFSLIPRSAFNRFIARAGYTVETQTFGRVNAQWLNEKSYDDDMRNLKERNMRGVCEIADLLYANDNRVIGESGGAIRSFSNEGYSETLADNASSDARLAFEKNLRDIINTYFTDYQLNRRMGV